MPNNFVSVLDYGAVPSTKDNPVDCTSAFQAAIDTDLPIFIPKGEFFINITIGRKCVIFGSGSTSTTLRPFDSSKPTIKYRNAAPYWTYHSTISYVGFGNDGKNSKTGVGVTFGADSYEDHGTNSIAAYDNNLKFYSCFFQGLEKGVFFPAGNIGTEFYSCGFSANKYGVMMLDSKDTQSMHAGCKYFYAGEFSSNTVAVYLSNRTDGFGSVTLKDTIVEQNKIGFYCNVSPRSFTPVTLDDVWFEANGQAKQGTSGSDTVNIDVYNPDTNAYEPQDVIIRTLHISGNNHTVNVLNGFFCDCLVDGDGINVNVSGSRAEINKAVLGGAVTVLGDRSRVVLTNCNAFSSNICSPDVIYQNAPYHETILANSSTTYSSTRAFSVAPRTIKSDTVSGLVYSNTYTESVPLGGFTLSSASAVDGGRLFNKCCQAGATFTGSNALLSPQGASFPVVEGKYYATTIDFRAYDGGSVGIRVWDRSANQAYASALNAQNSKDWTCVSCIFLADNTTNLLLDFGGSNDLGYWQFQAFQVVEFDSYNAARNYIDSGVFAMPPGGGNIFSRNLHPDKLIIEPSQMDPTLVAELNLLS